MKDECVVKAFYSLIFFKFSTFCFAFMVSIIFHIIYSIVAGYLAEVAMNLFNQNKSEDYIS